MGTGGKIVLSLLGVAVLGTVAYLGYTHWNTPALVSKSGKKMVIRFRGKKHVIDVDYLSKKGVSYQLPGNKWSLVPSYGNQSDKSTLNGLYVQDSKGVTHRIFYF